MTQSIKEIVSAVVRSRFHDVDINDITVEPDEDNDGDPILRISVVFEGDAGALDAGELAGLVRHVRPKLLEHQESSFPIFSFISKRELVG